MPLIASSSDPMPAAFHAFCPNHQIVLILCAALLILLALARWKHAGLALILERVMGAGLLLSWPFAAIAHWHLDSLGVDNALPMHFCDIAGLAGFVALWTRQRLACEMVYFFGMAGTLQGLLTPNLKVDFPDPRFFVFFLQHGGVVVTALHVVTSMRCPPRVGAIRRMFAVTMLYTLGAAMVNQILGANYGFLCHKPEQASLMDSLGPWPWYVGSMILLCVVFYSLLYIPFAITRRWHQAV